MTTRQSSDRNTTIHRPGLTIPPSTTPPFGDPNPSDRTELTSALSPISPWPPSPPTPPSESPNDDDLPSPSQWRSSARPIRRATHLQAHGNGQDLPNAVDIYSSIAVLGTYALFGLYLVWAFSPAEKWWVGWLPDRQWAIIVPCWIMVVVLLTYWSYAALVIYRTPSFDSSNCITDPFSNIPEHSDDTKRPSTLHKENKGSKLQTEPYYWRFAGAGQDGASEAEAVDLPIDLVGRVLYSNRPRHKPK
ncbi:hypothetical protein IAT40_004984 [Kwoniella sp. CBS 6097]